MIKTYPDLSKHISNEYLDMPVNMEYTSTNKDLDNKDEIAVFPPVSGG